MSGKPAKDYKGVGEFFHYLSNPEVQAKSHQATGYLPVTYVAYKLTEQSGFYKNNPGTDVAVNQMVRKTTDKSRGIRLGQLRPDSRHHGRRARAGLVRQILRSAV